MAKAKARTITSPDGIRRINVHTHMSQVKLKGSPSAYVRRMRKQGTDAIVLLAPGEVCKKAVDRFGDFVIPVPMYRLLDFPDRDLRKDMEYWLDRGCKGIKFIAPLHPYSDERYWPLYQIIDERGVVVTFHTGFLGFRGNEPQSPPIEIVNMRAAHVDAVSRRFPDLKIIMAHFSNPWWEEAWKVSYSRPNVYADLSGGTAILRSMNMWAEMFAPEGKIIEQSVKKLCFGTDLQFLGGEEPRLPLYIEFYQKLLDRINAPQRLRKLVWADNARKLFGIK